MISSYQAITSPSHEMTLNNSYTLDLTLSTSPHNKVASKTMEKVNLPSKQKDLNIEWEIIYESSGKNYSILHNIFGLLEQNWATSMSN